jgi:hypothetical protein
MHRIAVGGGVMGVVFAVGCSVIFLLGVPASRWFLLASLFVGVGVGGSALRLAQETSSGIHGPLPTTSI